MLSRRDPTRRPAGPVIVLGATALLSALAGYVVGRTSTSHVQSQTTPPASAQHREKHDAAERGDLVAERRHARLSGMITPGDDEELAAALLTAVQHRDYFRRKHDLFAIAMTLDADGIRRAIEATQRFSATDRDWAQPTLVARWLDLDRDAAWHWIRALPAGEQRDHVRREFFHSLGLKDPRAALPFLEDHAVHRDGDEYHFVDSVFEAWSTHDPVAAAQAAAALPRRDDRGAALSHPLDAWASADPRGALAFAQALKDPELRDEYVREVLKKWAASDPEQALAVTTTFPAGKQRNQAVAGIIRGAALKSAAAAIALIDAMPPGIARTEITSSLLMDRHDEDPDLAVECLLRLPLEEQAQAINHLIPSLAKRDPARALKLAGSLATPKLREQATNQALSHWADEDPAAAADFWLKSYQGQETGALYGIVSDWAQTDFPAALAWTKQLPPGKARDVAAANLVGHLADQQPEVAIQHANALLTGEDLQEALVAIAATWADSNPAAAARFAEQLPEHDSRANAVQQIAGHWAQHDLEGAVSWLNALPPGAIRDHAVSGFVQTTAKADVEGALAWARTISGAEQREGAIESLLYHWHQHDNAAALAWLRANGLLSAERRNRLLKSFTAPRDEE